MENHYGSHHGRIAETSYLCGCIYIEENNLKAGEEEFLKALQLLEQAQHCDAYLSLEKLYDIYHLQAQTTQQKDLINFYQQKSRDYITRSFTIIRNCFPDNSEHFKRISRKYKQAQRK